MTLLAFIFALPLMAQASNLYYPQGFEQALKGGQLKDQDLKVKIFEILATPHQKVAGKNDVVTKNCSGTCVSHTILGYGRARTVMFGKIDLQRDARGYYLTDVYCHQEFTGKGVGPNLIPNSNIVNCEHTWPQSRFTSSFPDEMQKSDLHHLYVTSSRANSTRGNNPFGEVTGPLPFAGCEISQTGKIINKTGSEVRVFQPPREHQGNVARALFYFSVRYKLPIDATQEETLRQWSKDDPVTAEDVARNDAIEKEQGDRNPFIDFPELADSIADF